MPSPRILLLEDNASDQKLVEETLRSGGLSCEVVHAKTKEEFCAALQQAKFDLILSDFTLPGYSGIDALTESKRLQPETPFIFVSGTMGEERAVESLKSGATDCILKDRLDRLGPAVERALRESRERSERKRAEQQVRIRSSALEAAANGIILTDKDGQILFANKAFCVMTGYTLEEIHGKTPGFLKSGKQDRDFFHTLWETILACHVWHGEVINRRKDGTLYHEEMTITPIQGDQGEITHFIAVKQDITSRKQLEDQYHQAQKMEAVGRLAGGIAHDFNNLLVVIHGNVDLVLRNENQLNEQTRRCLTQVVAASKRAANLTRQLLTFGRKQAVLFQPFNLNAVIASLTKMLDRVIGEDVSVQCDYENNLAPVYADVGMIEQVLVNLILNARDAMPKGGVVFISTKKVTLEETCVEIHPDARPGEFICVTVRDKGTGIAPEDLARIFEPFFTTKAAGKGTGLGLATAYGIIKQHQGWIQVSSQLDAGTAFKIFLPADSSGVAKAPAIPEVKTNRIGGQEKILLVEDDLEVRMLTRQMLEKAGYKIWEADSGLDAINVWEANSFQFDLVITDIVMPGGVDGKELAERLRIQRPRLKVIFTTGYGPEIAGKNYPPDYFLQKPSSMETLIETVRNCLDEK